MTTIDYSVWDHIEVSDDEDDTHPNIDTPSLFRWRHQARVERMEAFMKKGEELEKSLAESRRKLAEAQRRVQELSSASTPEAKADLAKAQEEEKQLKKQERSWEKKMQEHRTEEKKMPWNVDTLSKEGFSKSVVNIKPEKEDETEEEKEEKHKTFVEKYEKQIKHFGMLRRWDDSQKYLSDNPHLVCEETANYLVIMCIDLEVEEKHALMEQVAHQTIVMQFILELSKSLKVDPRGCFRQFFAKIKTAALTRLSNRLKTVFTSHNFRGNFYLFFIIRSLGATENLSLRMASMVFQLMGMFLGIVGWCLESSSINSAMWRKASHGEAVMTASSRYEGLWMSCASNSLGAVHCQRFKTVLGLPGYIQACRALMIIALILGLLAVILAAMGLKCTKLGSTSEETKGKISLTAGVMFILSGVCVTVAVSWYAARIVQEFYDPSYVGTKYELGAGLYLGWAAAALEILGGAILCTSFKSSRPAQTRSHNYNYIASQPQKIYRSAPSENSVSKAYV